MRADDEGDLSVELGREVAIAFDPHVREQDDELRSFRPQGIRMLADERQLVGEIHSERVLVEIAPGCRREPDQADTNALHVEQHTRLDARDEPAVAPQVRGKLRIPAGGRLVDERFDPVPDHRPVATATAWHPATRSSRCRATPLVRLLSRSVVSSTSPASI